MMILSQTIKPHQLKEHAEDVIKRGYKIELMLNADWVSRFKDKSLIDDIAFIGGGNIISCHAPHHSLNIGSKDKNIRKYSIDLILSSIEIARELGAKEFVFHSTFMPLVPKKVYKEWCRLSEEGFKNIEGLCKEYGIIPCLENTYEKDGDLLEKLFNDYPAFYFCLDTGHVNCLSSLSLDNWLLRLSDKIRIVHIHDNLGDEDSHLDISEGNIEFKKVIEALDINSVRFNLETSVSNFIKNAKKLEEFIN